MTKPDDYTHHELLFALEIRRFAQSIRMDEMPYHVRNPESEHVQTRWFEENPLPKFIKRALKETTDAADEIREIRSSQV